MLGQQVGGHCSLSYIFFCQILLPQGSANECHFHSHCQHWILLLKFCLIWVKMQSHLYKILIISEEEKTVMFLYIF